MSKMYSTANLSDKELKEQGNRLFDLHKYEDAASCYTKAIVSIMTFLASVRYRTIMNRDFGSSRVLRMPSRSLRLLLQQNIFCFESRIMQCDDNGTAATPGARRSN